MDGNTYFAEEWKNVQQTNLDVELTWDPRWKVVSHKANKY